MKSILRNRIKDLVREFSITNRVLLLCCCFFFLSCSSPSLTNITHYGVENIKNSIEQFTFKETLTYIPLETNQNCLVGAINKIILTSDYIFVFTENMLYQFDAIGKFIRRIGSEGRGPAEYVYIVDVSVDEVSGKIYICDNSGQKINIYNMSGDYLGSKTRSGFWKSFEVIDDKYFINPLNLSGKEPCMLKVIAEDDSTICFKNNVLYNQHDLFLVPDIKNFQKLNNELYFHQQFNDTIYRFDNMTNKLSVSYYFDFGNLRFPYDLLGSLDSFDSESSKYGYLFDICENNSNIFTTIFYKGENEKYVIDKKTGKTYSVDKKQDLYWPRWSSESGVLVTFKQANYLIKHRDEILDTCLMNVLSVMKENDNPMIILIKEKS